MILFKYCIMWIWCRWMVVLRCHSALKLRCTRDATSSFWLFCRIKLSLQQLRRSLVVLLPKAWINWNRASGTNDCDFRHYGHSSVPLPRNEHRQRLIQSYSLLPYQYLQTNLTPLESNSQNFGYLARGMLNFSGFFVLGHPSRSLPTEIFLSLSITWRQLAMVWDTDIIKYPWRRIHKYRPKKFAPLKSHCPILCSFCRYWEVSKAFTDHSRLHVCCSTTFALHSESHPISSFWLPFVVKHLPINNIDHFPDYT